MSNILLIWLATTQAFSSLVRKAAGDAGVCFVGQQLIRGVSAGRKSELAANSELMAHAANTLGARRKSVTLSGGAIEKVCS